MRYYFELIGDSQSWTVDCFQDQTNQEEKSFRFSGENAQGEKFEKSCRVRFVAGYFFYSFDSKRWNKLNTAKGGNFFVDGEKKYKVHRGHRIGRRKEDVQGGLVSTMPGKVMKVMVKEGDKVEVGTKLLIIEAMKMENEVKAPYSGIIEKVMVSEGKTIEAGSVLLSIGTKES